MKKRVLAAALAAATVLSLAGCNQGGSSSGTSSTNSGSSSANSGATSGESSGATSSESPANPDELTDEDETLSLLSWSGNEDMQLMIDFYCEKTGFDKNKIKVVTQGDSGGAAKEAYQNYLKGTGDADILYCDAGWAQLYENNNAAMVANVGGDLVMPLSELGITKDQQPNAYPYTLQVGTNAKGEFVGATWQATPGCFVYNAKLAKQYLDVETPEDMQALVKDWDTFEQTAAKLKEASNGAVKMVCTEAGLWQVKQCDKKDKWVKDDVFAFTGEAESFIDFAKKYTDEGYVDANIGTWCTAWWNTLNDGSALGEFIPTWGLKGTSGSMLFNFAAGAQDVPKVDDDGNPVLDDEGKQVMESVVNDSAATDLFSACAGPQSWYWGGTYMCVAAKCNTKKTAADWIKFFTQNEDAMKEYAQKNGDFMNSTKAMEGVTYKNPVLIDGQDQFAILFNEAKKINMGDTITMYDADINDKFNAQVADYCKGTVSKDDILPNTKTEVIKLFPGLTATE